MMGERPGARGKGSRQATSPTSSLLPLAFVTSVFLFGCSSESSAPPQSTGAGSPASESSPISGGSSESNQPPVVRSARVLPDPASRNDTLSLEVLAEDPEGGSVTVRYQWLANGVAIEGQTSQTLIPTMVKRGDRVGVAITPVDLRGAAGEVYRTKEVEIVNTPPVVAQVTLAPAVARAGDRLEATIEGSDIDGDPVRYVVQWWRNKQPIPAPADEKIGSDVGERRTLSTAGFMHDDTIVVGVTPYDAAGAGKIAYSELVLTNSAPKITSSPATAIADGRYTYSVTAVDPDNDTLTYKLDAAPPGMTIDAASGRIEWRIAPDAKGPQRVRVSVNDGRQGQAFQDFVLTPPAR
jgi:Putative Ig domain